MTNRARPRAKPDRYSQRFWDALDRLEHDVDDLSTRILTRTAEPPKTSRSPKASSSTSKTPDDADLFIERMTALSKTVSILRDCLDAPASDMPGPAKRRSLRRIVHPELEGNADTALRARVGRAARRYGLSFNEWVERYGMVDRHPDR